MQVLNYCLKCQRLFSNENKCDFCGSESLKPVQKRMPVNVLGTKIKGNVLYCKDDVVSIIISGESNEKMVRKYKVHELKKVL